MIADIMLTKKILKIDFIIGKFNTFDKNEVNLK